MLREMVLEDVTQVVEVHRDSFAGFFLTSLGPRFLSLYYRGVLRSPDHIAFVVEDSEGAVGGFVAGSTNPRGFYMRLLKRDWFQFGWASFGGIIRHPEAFGRVVRAVSHPGRNPCGEDVAGLFSVGVSPVLQGTGAGRKLVDTFLSRASSKGCRRVFLTTDRDENDSVNKFYSNLGFVLAQQFETPEGRRMNEYWIDLPGQASE